MKHMILAALSALILITSTPSKAAIGGIVGVPAVVYVGICLTVPSGLYTLVVGTKEDPTMSEVWFMLLAVPVLLTGLLILDGEEGQEMAFDNLDAKAALKLGVSESERLSFNQELDQVNFLVQEAASEISQIENAKASDSKAIWENLRNEVSPETFSAMQKITAQLVK